WRTSSLVAKCTAVLSVEYVALGRTGLRASVTGLGCGGFSRAGLGRGESGGGGGGPSHQALGPFWPGRPAALRADNTCARSASPAAAASGPCRARRPVWSSGRRRPRCSPSGAPGEPLKSGGRMEYATLGRTGLKVSVAGLGCGGFSRLGLGTGKSTAEAVALV